MAIVVTSNIPAVTAQRYIERSQRGMQVAMARLASGLRVNSAADDAAGLAISEKIRTQIRGFSMAKRNATNAVSVTQTADSGLGCDWHDQ